MDFATGFAAGLAFGKKKFGGGSDEEWKLPSDWPDVPEPGDYEMCFLVYTNTNNGNSIYFTLSDPETAGTGEGRIIADWGDGTTETINGRTEEGYSRRSSIYHTYDKDGMYVVKIITDEKNCFFQAAKNSFSGSFMLIAKIGKNIVLNNGSDSHTQTPFYYQYRLRYIKLNCEELPRSGAFKYCYALQKVEMRVPPTIIRADTFMNNYSLQDFDFSEVVSVENNAIVYSGFDKIYMPKCTSIGSSSIISNYALREINLPNCITVSRSAFSSDLTLQKISLPKCEEMGDNVFSGCYALAEVIISDECKFGQKCFSDCYALIPKPDGTL